MDLEDYRNKDNVWGYDDLTKLIDSTVRAMPDLPKHLAVILAWSDAEDTSIKANIDSSGPIFGVHAIKYMDIPFRLYFIAMSPDNDFSLGDFLASLVKIRFSECVFFNSGKATLRIFRWESLEEAREKHLAAQRAFQARLEGQENG